MLQYPQVNHVTNAVQDNQQQLVTQIQKIQAMIQYMQLQHTSTQTSYQ